MSRGTLPYLLRISLAIAGLLSYATTGLLGNGLHRLTGCDHAAHSCSSHHSHSHGGDAHRHSAVTRSPDDCAICSFLAQAQSSFAPSVAPSDCEPLAEAPIATESLVLSLPAYAPLARGPPQA